MNITRFSQTKWTMDISVVAECSLLILNENASTYMPSATCECLSQTPIFWLTSWAYCRHKHNHDFFWLWTVLPNGTVSVTNTHEWNEAQIISRIQLIWSEVRLKQLVDQSPMLGDIFLALNSWSLMPFSVDDNHDILRIYLACGSKQQNDHAFTFCLVWRSVGLNRGRKHPHFVSGWSPTENVATKRLIKSGLHTMSSSMWWSQQLFESHLWSSQ